MSTRYLRLTFDSDWHVGSGAGIPGSVDRQVLRDEEGFPYVPGKTLTGILRDAAEWIADTRDAAEEGDRWKRALIGLFGEQPETHGGTSGESASGASIGIGSAVLSPDLRGYILGAREASGIDLRETLFTVRPGVKIDPETGRALDDHLFSTERVRGCVLCAPVKYLKGALSEDEEKLWGDAVRAVRRLGGKRRRGGGRCRLGRVDSLAAAEACSVRPKFPEDGAVELEFRLTTRQPVVINKVTLGNVVRSEMTIPGVSLLPWFTREVLEPLGEEALRAAVLDGELSVGNFLPEVGGVLSLPVPLCLAEEKESKTMLNRLTSLPADGVQMKDLRTGYVQAAEKGMRYCPADARRLLRTHNTVEDERQRPTERVGGLFSYEAIRAGRTFRGTVRMSAELWKKVRGYPEVLKRLAYGELSIGQSRKDEYGAVSLEYVPSAVPSMERLWSPALPVKNGKNYLVVYLLSDLLIRGVHLNYSLSLEDLKDALSAALDVELQDVQDWELVEGRKGVRRSPLGGSHGHCVRVGRRESWQTRWNLSRPSLSYFQAGSVLLFQVMDPEKWDAERARKLVREGLGDRRAEGYGRVLLNPPFLCGEGSGVEKLEPSKETQQTQQPLSPDLPKHPEDRELVLSLAEGLFKKRFRQAARQTAYALLEKSKDAALFDGYRACWREAPKNSQFGILREFAALIGDAPERSSLEPVREWLKLSAQNADEEDKESWKKPWRDWVGALAEEPGRIWALAPSFQAVQGSFLPVFSDSERERLTLLALAAFWDVFCEAVFDKKKEESA